MTVTRRGFFRTSAGVWAAGAAVFGGMSTVLAQDAPKPKKKRPPQLDSELVHEFVAKCHTDLERTRELLKTQPALINATWDWGGGDFETGLGGAAHMGRPDIANFLLSRGARLDVFAAAMLGKLDVVMAAIAAFPDIPNVPGPHGIPLIRHAEAGGEAAAPVLAYLKSLAADGTR